jgi:hypothetical protein
MILWLSVKAWDPIKAGPPPAEGLSTYPRGNPSPRLECKNAPRMCRTEDGLRDLSNGQKQHALSRTLPDKHGSSPPT